MAPSSARYPGKRRKGLYHRIGGRARLYASPDRPCGRLFAVRRRWLFPGVFAFTVVAASPAAYAQGPVEDAAAEIPSARVPASPAPTTAPAPASSSERPVRGPALRERSGRRSRGASTASGVLMLVMLIAFMGYYVVKKLRR
jgi:hypothetical protein